MKIQKKVCDGCKKETGMKEMYLTIDSNTNFVIHIKSPIQIKFFSFSNLDFCSIKCFENFLEKLLLKNIIKKNYG